MASFLLYAPVLSRWEGGFVNDPADPGGATNRGVTLATFRRFYGADRTVDDLKRMTERQWRRIMRTYWDTVQGDRIESQSIAEIFADWHINAGVNAIKRVQRMFGIKADGIVGNVTLSYLNSPNAEAVFNDIRDERASYYLDIVKKNPSQQVFLKGWLRRTNSFQFKK